MWLEPNSLAYFQEQAEQHGAIVLEDLPLPDERFTTASGIPRTSLLVARTTAQGYALLVSEDLTPRQPSLAGYFAETPVTHGWRLLALPAYDSLQEALTQAGRLLGLEPDAPARQEQAVPLPAPQDSVRVPARRHSGESADTSPSLPGFTRDLNSEARRGTLAPVQGRERELEEVLTILLQQSKNCPLLVGEPGVGKTAVAEKLAQHAVDQRLPAPLRNLRVLALDLPALLAASGQKGALERHVSALCDSLEANAGWLLFVDEVHSLADTRGDMAVFDLLKPRMTAGLRLMGATTHREYQIKIAPDPALARRFATVTVEEPDPGMTEAILLSRLPGLEAHHQVRVRPGQIAEIVRLADEYFPDRRRPDKALSLLDRAMAAEALKGYQANG